MSLVPFAGISTDEEAQSPGNDDVDAQCGERPLWVVRRIASDGVPGSRRSRVTANTDAALDADTTFTHDGDGQMQTRTDALQRITSMTYPAGGRLASITDARNQVRTFSETPTTRTTTDALSRTTVRHMNAYGLNVSTAFPGGTQSTISHVGSTPKDESASYPSQVVDEGSRPRTYSYDPNGGLNGATALGEQGTWQYTYGLSRGGDISWDAEQGSVALVPVDSRGKAHEF